MILKIELSDLDGELLNHLAATSNSPEITPEQVASALLDKLLMQIWADLNNNDHILN